MSIPPKKPWQKPQRTMLDQALAMATMVPIFPCLNDPNNKKPLTPHGFKDASQDPEKIREWWNRHPDAWIGMPTGRASGRIVVDLDRKPNQPDGTIEWPKFLAEHGAEDLETHLTQTPSGGQHLTFQNVEGLRPLPLHKLWPGVEVKAEGGYVIIAPSPGYKRMNKLEPAPCPEWLADIMLAMKARPVELVYDATDVISDDRKKAYGETALAGMAEEVMALAPGERSNGLAAIAYRAGRLVGGGCLEFKAVHDALEAAALTWGISRRDKALGPRGTIMRQMKVGVGLPGGPDDDEIGAHAPVEIVEGYIEKVATKRVKKYVEYSECPEHLLKVPGLVGDIAEWITQTAPSPLPLLSLGAALVIVGTAIGRKIAGPSGSGTHLYVVGIAPSTAGKEYPGSCIETILTASGSTLANYIGPSGFRSTTAFVNTLKKRQVIVSKIDEFGTFWRRVNGKRAGGWEIELSAEWRKAWGASFGILTTAASAQEVSEKIYAPAFSLFGMSTRKEFFDSLQGADVANGLLSRMLVLETKQSFDYRDADVDRNDVPDHITSQLAELAKPPVDPKTNKPLLYQLIPQPERLDESDDAKAIRLEFHKEMKERGKVREDVESLYGRVAETATRLATIVTAGMGVQCIEADVMTWAKEFARWSYETMISTAGLNISDSDIQGLANEMKRNVIKLRKRNDPWVTMRDLYRSLGTKHKPRDIQDVMVLLDRSEEFELRKVTPKKGGKVSTLVRLID